ncbi:helix-turn-helix transcriptional regulator [Halopiger thermotolerans]
MSSNTQTSIPDVPLVLPDGGVSELLEPGLADGRSVASPAALSDTPLQLAGPHLAALFGIVALALLGGVLAVRNRLDERDQLAASQEQPADEFVTDREKIRQLVTENGGRMKQSRIVDSVDWSKAKVSRLLAELEEEGQITKLRLGRENLVCLPGHEPTASKSPEQAQNE